MDYSTSPDYLKAADLHNLGSGTPSFFSDPVQSTVDFAGNVVDVVAQAPAFALSSIASGINSIYNSGVVAGNFFGITDAKENDIQQTLGSFDSDLGKYYGDHKQGADLVGFIATSFVPGIGGVKLLNTGQKMLSVALETGGAGRTFARATGLIETVTADGISLTQVAGKALAEGQQTFTLMNAGVLKAIGSGTAQATLESAAFEAMVQATMFRSPILEDQDIKDIGSNILTGALLGGAIGGAINAAGVYGGIKKVISAADKESQPFRATSSMFGHENDPQARLMLASSDIANTPEALTDAHKAFRSQKITGLEQEQRNAINQMADKDPELAGILANTLIGGDPTQMVRALQGAQKIYRPGYELTVAEGHTVGYVTMHGEGMGKATFTKPAGGMLSLADTTTVVGSQTMADAVLAKVKAAAKGWGGVKDYWSPITASGLDEIEARYIWAEKIAKYKDGMAMAQDDIPLLEGALRNKLNYIVVREENGVEYTLRAADMEAQLRKSKELMVHELGTERLYGWNYGVTADAEGFYEMGKATKISSQEIAKAVNVSTEFIESSQSASMFARQDAQATYDAMLKAKGVKTGQQDLDYIPRTAAVVYKTEGLANETSDTVSALINIKQQQKIQQAATDNAAQGVFGKLSDLFFHPGETAMQNANRYGAGAGLVTFANGSYGTLASWAETIGKSTASLQAKLKGDTANIMDSVVLRLRTDQAAAIEFDKVRNLVASTTEKYVMNEQGNGLVAAKTAQYRKDMLAKKEGVKPPVLQAGAPDEIDFVHELTGDAVSAHISANGARVQHGKNLKSSVGLEDSKDPNVFYAYKPDPRDMPHFAFVKDTTATGEGMGHTSMIHAATAHELEDMMKMVQAKTGFKVYTKADAENFYKAQQSYEFDRTLHDNYIDSSLKSAGVNNQFFPKTDPNKIVDEFLRWHAKGDDMLAREAVSTKFGHEFDQLETLGQQYTNVAGSRYASNSKSIENTMQNPYNDYRKTALNVSRLGEYPLLTAFNRNLEQGVSRVYQKVKDVFDQAKDVNDLQKVNDALQEAGINHAYKNAAEIILANHSAPTTYVSNFIRGANAILANTFLRLDPLNALNNALGAQVLLGHETSTLIKAIKSGNSDLAGELSKISSVGVPGTTDSILSTPKLIAGAQGNYYKMMRGEAPELAALYKANGWTTTIMEQHRQMLDNLTVGGGETPAMFNNMLSKAQAIAKQLAEKGEKWTGNKLAEEYNRFIAADVARQISDLGVKAGVLNADSQLSYINTFVNRTQGNSLASQRPLIFQGPVGQAVGLFQTFQFNTMQQLFRGVSEGGAKDAAMLVGLQGTMYGMNGLPAFQFINQHIVGTASGNKEHTDAYSTLYGAAGKTAGDWLMYGIPSNLLQTNIYSRGDINPRTLTVIPVNPQDIVAVSAFAKFAGNLKETVSKIAGGGDVWQSILQGVEHNGISRPLAGLAQTLQATSNPSNAVFSTTNSGDLSFANDFFSLATVSRLAGGKPLDEALANDEAQRSMVYQATDRARMKAATETFKTTVIGDRDGTATPAAVENYMASFVHNGGRVEQFNQNMLHAMTTANTPKANLIIQSLKGAKSEHMKLMMGGSLTQELAPDPVQ